MRSNKLAWERLFKKQGRYFERPHSDMEGLAQSLLSRGAKRVLDLGSGTGRHVVYLAQKGFDVYGLDISETGVGETRKWLEKEGLTAKVSVHDITKKLPFKDGFFDAVISIQVIHHAELGTVKKIIGEIGRILKKDGLLFVTVPFYKGYDKTKPGWTMKRIAERTYLPLDGQEKGLVHYFFTKPEFRKSFPGFNIDKTYTDDTNHYALIATKK